jgi:hypothetical protein
MAPEGIKMQADRLRQAKAVLALVMRLKTSKLLFNEPVDPVALGLDDYLDKVKQPMDFGTIMGRLQAGEKTGWKSSHYQAPADVLSDVSLVFDNCLTYNDGDQDAVTRDLAEEVRDNFRKRWTEAGLSQEVAEGSQEVEPAAVEWQDEGAVPPAFSSQRGTSDAAMTASSLRLPA